MEKWAPSKASGGSDSEVGRVLGLRTGLSARPRFSCHLVVRQGPWGLAHLPATGSQPTSA
jgi:hypothetical protein